MILGLEAQDAGVSFQMAFVKPLSNNRFATYVFPKPNIKPGDLFKIFLRPTAGSYVYLILHDAQNNLQVLFPQTFRAFESPGYAQTGVFIPEGDHRTGFTLDNAKGTERFYLLASVERLRTLESRINAYQKNAAKKGSATAAVNASRQAVLDEIQVLIKAHSRLAAAAEKPVIVGGGGRDEGIEATRIDAGVFYSRTFRLEH